jgi:CCR4-NOT transcription complex subunit 7/8
MGISQKKIQLGNSTLTSIKSKGNLIISNDFYSPDSIDLLENAGIDFKTLFNKGTSPHFFAENLIPSGLILNENVHWITFHGVYDFAYLLKNITNTPLPDDETLFNKNLECYFPNFYDVRYLINNNNFQWMKGSLTKIANLMDIKRLGSSHQAGSDSLITSKLFFKLLDTYPDHIDLQQERNKIFGLNYRMYEDSEGINSTNNMPINMTFNNMYSKNPSFSSLQLNYNNEQNYGMINNNNINLNQNGYSRMSNIPVNSINNQNFSINQLNNQGNNMNMIRSSDSPTKFNSMINNNNNINRNSNNVMNMQGIKQNSANNSSNNLMYYPPQSNFNNLNNNFNNNPYNNQGYSPQMSFNNTNNISGANMYKNTYNGQMVGDYNNYMNPYYVQNGFKNSSSNITTI